MNKVCKAPILILTYSRFEHLRQTIESLAANQWASSSPLFIAVDAPYRDEDVANNQRIIDFIGQIRGFKELNLFVREKNLGVQENFWTAARDIFAAYDRMIILEDDIVTSTDFLNFMNKCLDVYESREDIFSVCGYNRPVCMPANYQYEAYLWKRFCGWGTGYWKTKLEKVNWDQDEIFNEIRNLLNNFKQLKRFLSEAQSTLPLMLHMLQQKKCFGDVRLSVYMFNNDMYSVFPVVSRVRNIGNDGSGTNCLYNKTLLEQEIYNGNGEYEIFGDLRPDSEIKKVLSHYLKLTFKAKLRVIMQMLQFKLGWVK